MNSKSEKTLTCPWWFLFTFDNPLRKLYQDPQKILAPFLHPGDHVLDVGCGMGYFTLDIARLVGENGRVTAADLQPQMLAGLQKRAIRAGLQSRITPHICLSDGINIPEPMDFVLTFWMVHEVRGRETFLREIYEGIKPGGKLFIAEPKVHVSKVNFDRTVDLCLKIGFIEFARPRVGFSRAIVLSK